MFRGYSGWGPGQLEGEIEAGAWLVLDPDPNDLFTGEPDELWRSVLRRQPGRLAWLADAPDDLLELTLGLGSQATARHSSSPSRAATFTDSRASHSSQA